MHNWILWGQSSHWIRGIYLLFYGGGFIHSKEIVKSFRIRNFSLWLIPSFRYQSLDYTYDRWYDIYSMWTFLRHLFSLHWLARTFLGMRNRRFVFFWHCRKTITSPVKKFEITMPLSLKYRRTEEPLLSYYLMRRRKIYEVSITG